MNKEMFAIFGTGFGITLTILLAIWMTWADTNDRIDSLDTRVSAQLIDLNSRVGRIEGILLARDMMGEAAASAESARENASDQ